MSEVQTDVAALITWAEEEARLNRKHVVRIGNDERAEKLEAIATELRKLEP